MKFIRDLFSENGSVSMMRMLSLISLLLAGWIAVRGLETHADLSGLSMLCGVFVGAAMGGKVMQKSFEVKAQNNSITDVSQQTKLSPPESR